MLKIVTTLLRGAANEAEEALFDANAIRVLEQQLREAASGLEHARRELACAMAHQASEERAVSALAARISELETAAREALEKSPPSLPPTRTNARCAQPSSKNSKAMCAA